jgi:hypothetical protein
MKINGLSIILILFFISCSHSVTPGETRELNLKFSYGVNSRNILNTFENTYTKDLILDGTMTVPFTLSDNDFKVISKKITEINFFAFPDTFIVPTGDTVGIITPFSIYKFEVNYKSVRKRLYWADEVMNPNVQTTKLRELTSSIESIIQSHPEYSKLPPAKGGYL